MSLALVSVVLAGYVWRNRRTAALLRAQLQQRVELQKRSMEGLESDQCLYPHARTAIAYALNPFLKAGTLWVPKEHPYAINSRGLRGPEIREKPPGRKRIVLLGDSWFFGWKLKDEDRLESHMRAVLKDDAYEVVTVALPGWNVRSEAAFLEGLMRVIDPDVVVWEICPNDTWDVGGVIPPGGLSWAFSPQNREPEWNAFTVMGSVVPPLPFVVDRYRENVARMARLRADYDVPVLVAPVDIPPAAWALLAAEQGKGLPAWFIPRVFAEDRKGWVGEGDSHPTPWMNERMALGYLARLVEMGAAPPLILDPGQEAVIAEWERENAQPPSPQEVATYVKDVLDQVPEAYAAGEDLRRVAAGVDEEGRMGRHGVLYLRTAGPRSAIRLDFDVERYAPRFARQVTARARTYERKETSTVTTFSGAAQRVTCRIPIPAGSRHPVVEVEWLFNSDECPDPTACTAARLVRASTE